MAATVRDEYASSNADSTVGVYNGLATKRGQAFNIHANAMLTDAQFYLRKEGSPTGDVFAELYETTGTLGTDCLPTGSAVATSTVFDASLLPATNGMVTFEFDGTYEMQADTNYAVVFRYNNGDTSNYVRMNRDNSSSTHEGNGMYGTTSWVANTYDYIFAVWGEDPLRLKLSPFFHALKDPGYK